MANTSYGVADHLWVMKNRQDTCDNACQCHRSAFQFGMQCYGGRKNGVAIDRSHFPFPVISLGRWPRCCARFLSRGCDR